MLVRRWNLSDDNASARKLFKIDTRKPETDMHEPIQRLTETYDTVPLSLKLSIRHFAINVLIVLYTLK